MKMAKASQADIEAAMDIVRILESLDRGLVPSELAEDEEEAWFDADDASDCIRAINLILNAAGKGSIGRVVYGMYMLLDPANKAIDPDLDYIEHHPERIAGEKAIKQRDELLSAMKMIAGQIQCPDALMGNVDIALAAITKAESS